MLEFASILLIVLGGLGAFLLGMKHLSEGLQAAAGQSLRKIMAMATSKRVVGVGTGIVSTILVRTGAGHITLVDDDVVAESNVNRQCPATAKAIGRAKVEAMAERLKEINPGCEVEARNSRFSSAASFSSLASFDLIVDAIDSVDCKAELILGAAEAGVPIVSSMGAALRLDPTKVKVTRFEKVEGDGLARALRQRFKKLGRFPREKFSCVWSEEPPFSTSTSDLDLKRPKGSLMPVTATFGMCLASEAIKILTKGETK